MRLSWKKALLKKNVHMYITNEGFFSRWYLLLEATQAFDCKSSWISLKCIDIHDRKQRVKINNSSGDWSKLSFAVSQEYILRSLCLRPLSFITFYTILFYFEVDIAFGSYADGNTPNDPNQDIETPVNTLKDSFVKLFDLFSIKLSKPMQTSIFFFYYVKI